MYMTANADMCFISQVKMMYEYECMKKRDNFCKFSRMVVWIWKIRIIVVENWHLFMVIVAYHS